MTPPTPPYSADPTENPSPDLGNGMLISFEGIDGAGKSTHIGALAKAFAQQGRIVRMTREPGGTPLAEQLRVLVLHEKMDPLTEALLIFAGRREHIKNVILPALARGEVVLCDRFTDASFAYQGGGRGFDVGILQTLENWVQQHPQHPQSLLQPHLTIWFDIPAEVAASRLVRSRVPDKFESETPAFFEKVSKAYAARMALDPKRFAKINANQSMEAVRAELLAALYERKILNQQQQMSE